MKGIQAEQTIFCKRINRNVVVPVLGGREVTEAAQNYPRQPERAGVDCALTGIGVAAVAEFTECEFCPDMVLR